MSKKLLYKKGYLIRIKSWENDADNYNTEEVTADTLEEAQEIVKFTNLFSKSSWQDPSKFIGNIYEPREGEQEKVHQILWDFYQNNRITFTEECSNAEEASDYLRDIAYDMGLAGGEFYTRVCEKVEVFKFDEDVYCEEVKFE